MPRRARVEYAGALTAQYVQGVQTDDILAKSTASGTGESVPVSLFGNRFLFTGRDHRRLGSLGGDCRRQPVGRDEQERASQLLAEIGLYDYRNRVYSPDLGRFLQTDPIRFSAGDGNLYRYVGNDAVNLWDPLGLDAWYDAAGDWFFERRCENRSYDSVHQITRDLMGDEGVQEARNAWNAAGRPDNFTYNYGFGVNDYLRELMTLDGTGSFLGSYQVNITKRPDGSTGFEVNNTTGWESGTRSPFPSARGNPSVEDMMNGAPFTPNPRSLANDRPRSAPGPRGNFRQNYYWNEP